MKKLFLFWLCTFLTSQLMAQPFQKKQITNFNFDSRGAVIPSYPLGLSNGNNSPMFFEVHDGNAVNIMMMSYNSDTDSFFNPVLVTQNSFQNINIDAKGFGYYLYRKIHVIWQTNENGSWDIALKTLTDTTWGSKTYIANSPSNETNPKFVARNNFPYSAENEIDILYEKENSIYLYRQVDSIVTREILFGGDNSNRFSQPTGVYYSNWYGSPIGLFVSATYKPNDSTSIIVYRFKTENDTIWSPIYVACDSGYCDNPNFFNLYFMENCMLSFEKNIESMKYIFIIEALQSSGQNNQAIRLLNDINLRTSELNMFMYGIMGKNENNDDYNIFGPHAFKLISNDSTYIGQKLYPSVVKYLCFTKVSDTRIGVGNLGISPLGNAISYTIWEDSSNGRINLFGTVRYDPLGGINDKLHVTNFLLYQNYPNPFNPKTVIKYSLLSRDFVSLKIFDALGNEIATLVNEEKEAGDYSLVFNGSNLASGIYLYRLTVGQNQLNRKMILLK